MLHEQFELGKLDKYKREYYNPSYSWTGYSWWDENENLRRSRSKFAYTNSPETTENEEGFVFRIPLSEISIENLKIVLEKNYMIVQSNKKTIFISIDQKIKTDKFSTMIKGDMLLIEVKK